MAGHYLGYKGGPGCGTLWAEKCLLNTELYICPQESTRSECGGQQSDFSCATWGCETISTLGGYTKQTDSHIILQRGPRSHACNIGSCNPILLTIKIGSRAEQDYWITERTWGLGLYRYGYDTGFYFTIQVKDIPRTSLPIGPNSLILMPDLPQETAPKASPKAPEFSTLTPIPVHISHKQPLPKPERQLVNMLTKVHGVLNRTSPDISRDCWLCLYPKPPYYIGVSVSLSITELNRARDCDWESPRLTLGDVQGKGTCLVSQNYSRILANFLYSGNCNETTIVPASRDKFYQATNNTWLACDSGLTQWAASAPLNMRKANICILVIIFPQVYIMDQRAGVISSIGTGFRNGLYLFSSLCSLALE